MNETIANSPGRTASFKEAVVDLTAEAGGYLRCENCLREEPVEARYWFDGWPKCCGYTMRWWTARQVEAGEDR